MGNIFVLMVFFGLTSGGAPSALEIEQVHFPHRAECDYAAKKINEEVPGAKAFCFDVRVAGDRHEDNSQTN